MHIKLMAKNHIENWILVQVRKDDTNIDGNEINSMLRVPINNSLLIRQFLCYIGINFWNIWFNDDVFMRERQEKKYYLYIKYFPIY